MRLIDRIIQDAKPVTLAVNGKVKSLPGADRFIDALKGTTHRFALQECAARAVAELAFQNSTLLEDALDIIRIPAASTWVEWIETPELYGNKGIAGSRRVGVLVNADEGGRSGTMHSFWCEHSGHPHVSNACLKFDFDKVAPLNAISLRTEPREHRLQQLFKAVWLEIDEAWAAYYQRALQSDAAASLKDALGQQIAADAPMVAAFSLLLSARDALRPRPIDNLALNKARARRRKAPLLDVVEMSMHLAPTARSDERNSATNVGRASPRLHHVRGHLYRRNDQLIWRRPHVRGNGLDARPRNVRAYL